MKKTKKLLISLGLVGVLTVGTAVTAFASLNSSWLIGKDLGSEMRRGQYVAVDDYNTYNNFHLYGNYNELRSGGYKRTFDERFGNGYSVSTPRYSSYGYSEWDGHALAQTDHMNYDSSSKDVKY